MYNHVSLILLYYKYKMGAEYQNEDNGKKEVKKNTSPELTKVETEAKLNNLKNEVKIIPINWNYSNDKPDWGTAFDNMEKLGKIILKFENGILSYTIWEPLDEKKDEKKLKERLYNNRFVILKVVLIQLWTDDMMEDYNKLNAAVTFAPVDVATIDSHIRNYNSLIEKMEKGIKQWAFIKAFVIDGIKERIKDLTDKRDSLAGVKSKEKKL